MSEKKAKQKRQSDNGGGEKVLFQVLVQVTNAPSNNLQVSGPSDPKLTIDILLDAAKLMARNIGPPKEPNRILKPHQIVPGVAGRG
jgi:hypothetical protein